MFRWIFIAILVMPALEIGVMIWAGGQVGPWWVVLLIVLTGIAGAWLAKKQGLETVRKAQQAMQMGQSPQEEIFDGLCILIGGIVLLTPGFITDAFGFVLLIPSTRKPVKEMIKKLLQKLMTSGRFTIYRR
ncbi:FxsA family protein [Gracilibacillus xinjiangensis]|uniref:FxsA family protein n=1 Tax=Gracilibacillus xinjiangensis TaxID=1193282 RepID=A0ABV8WX26_9BACI